MLQQQDQQQQQQVLQLHNAAHVGNIEEVRRLVEEQKVDPTSKATGDHRSLFCLNEWTPLHTAAACCSSSSSLEVVQYLVEEAHVNISVRDRHGQTPLHVAASASSNDTTSVLQVVRYLVEKNGGSWSQEEKNNIGSTPLHCACFHGCLETVQYLVEVSKTGKKKDDVIIINAKNRFGKTPLFYAFSSSSSNHRLDIVKYLLPLVDKIDDKQVLEHAWRQSYSSSSFPWTIKALLLEKYAIGCNLQEEYETYPIQTILQHDSIFNFASSTEGCLFLEECIEHLPRSTLSCVDRDGKFPIHVALLLLLSNTTTTKTSKKKKNRCCALVSKLAKLAPTTLLAKDPDTGMYPHELAATYLVNDDDGDDEWLNVIYDSFRSNPVVLLRGVLL